MGSSARLDGGGMVYGGGEPSGGGLLAGGGMVYGGGELAGGGLLAGGGMVYGGCGVPSTHVKVTVSKVQVLPRLAPIAVHKAELPGFEASPHSVAAHETHICSNLTRGLKTHTSIDGCSSSEAIGTA